jgi:hypothetical protein
VAFIISTALNASLHNSSFVLCYNTISQRSTAGKESDMLQQVTIQTPNAKRLKPLLKSAIQSQLDDIEHGIQLTRARLEAFEKQYNMSTTEFLRRFTPDDLGETLDFIDWQGETKMLTLLEEKKVVFKEAQVK